MFFILATAATGALAALDVLRTIPAAVNVGRDWSIPETFNYLKWLVIASVLLVAYLQRNHRLLSWLSAFFLFLMLDDSLQLHEGFGRWASTFIAGGDHHRHIVQILYWTTTGTTFLIVLSRAFRVAPKDIQAITLPLLVPFAGLAFFGVFVDFFHTFFEDGTVIAGLFILLEDGGELLMISALTAYVLKQFAFSLPARGASTVNE